jgi:hypothetical protein
VCVCVCVMSACVFTRYDRRQGRESVFAILYLLEGKSLFPSPHLEPDLAKVPFSYYCVHCEPCVRVCLCVWYKPHGNFFLLLLSLCCCTSNVNGGCSCLSICLSIHMLCRQMRQGGKSIPFCSYALPLHLGQKNKTKQASGQVMIKYWADYLFVVSSVIIGIL